MEIADSSDNAIDRVVATLLAGGTMVYPTETCYGLGCDATNETAVEKVFAIKGREKRKTVLMLASSIAMVKDVVLWSETAEQLAKKYWPGALTMVLPLRPGYKLSELLIGEGTTVAFRVSHHPWVARVATQLSRPIVSTSANRSGGENPYSVTDVLSQIGGGPSFPDIVIDAGELPVHPPSTIVRVVGDTIEILRQGDITVSLS